MPAKFIGYFRLVDACAKPGCPVCRCLREDALRHLRTLIGEHVTDPATRGLIRAARGFCTGHAAMLQDIPDAGFGAAIISAELLAAEGRRARRLIPPQRRKGPLRRLLRGRARGVEVKAACLTCRNVQVSETRYLKEMLGSVGEPEFEQALERADGLCRPHLTLLAEQAESGTERALERLVEWNRAKWGRIHAVLERFIEKHDYRRRAPLTEEEAAAWRLALDMLAGAPAVRS